MAAWVSWFETRYALLTMRDAGRGGHDMPANTKFTLAERQEAR
jgi:hypothetical protein